MERPAAVQLIGRRHELEALRAAVAEVASGSPVVVVLTGPPGVGKTSLAHAGLEFAGAAGFVPLAGRAHPLSNEAAYAPVAAALGAHLHALDTSCRADLLADLPQLGLLFSGLGLVPPAPLGDPALEGSRLLDGLIRLVQRLARERPVALLLDDFHDADTASAAFVAQLCAVLTDSPILLLLTARPEDPGRARVARLAGSVPDSGWRLTREEIEPLGDANAAALVREVLGTAADDASLVERIVGRCGGRPLFLDAVARTVRERLLGDPSRGPDAVESLLPEGLRGQLLARLAGLDPAERDVLELLAVADGDLDYEVLRRASSVSPDQVVTALDGLHRRALVRSADGVNRGGYDLAHGLLGDALLSTLSPTGRMRVHARLATALGETRPDDPRLPEHALAAGELLDAGAALDYLMTGARHARSLGALDSTARYLGAAVGLAADRPKLLAQLERERADALRRSGRPDEARAAWLVALREYTQLGEPDSVAAIEQELGMLDWSAGELARARARFDTAERVLRDLPPSLAHAAFLHGQAITASRLGDTETMAEVAARLRALAGRLDSATVSVQAALAEAALAYANSDYVAMTERTLLGLAAAEQVEDPMLIIRAHDQLSVAAASQLDVAALRDHSQASLDIARQLGALVLEPWPRGRLAVADLFAGEWEAALRATSDMVAIAIRHGERRGSVSATAGHAWVLTHRGRLAEARQHLARAREVARPALEQDRNVFSIVALADATLALFAGEPEQALSWADRLRVLTGGWLPLLGLAVLGEAYAGAGRADEAREVVDRLRSVRSCRTVAPTALASWVAGVAAGTTGETELAAAELRTAASAFDELGLPFYAARARLATAAAEASAHPDDARELGRAALETFDTLGAPIQAQQAREVLRGLGVVPSRGRPRGGKGPLSARELEVARLVAAGLTNAEVATALFISPRTVSTHLDHIYSRLGLGSRVALTRYLADSGLLESDT